MRVRRALLVAVLVVLVAVIVVSMPPRRGPGLVFRPLSVAQRQGKSFLVWGPFVNNGIIVDAARDYPAALAAEGDSRAECSATLVGPRAMLSAGHCFDIAADGGTPSVSVEVGTQHFKATCYTASADVALCLLDGDVKGILFDTISRRPPALNDRITLSGWADPPGQSFPSSIWRRLKRRLWPTHQFRTGTARIVALGPLLRAEGESASGPAPVVAPGDSGGAAYDAQRAIVGVNVCGGGYCRGVGSADDATTTLTDLTDGKTAAWVDWWSRSKGPVCGFNLTENCRGR